MNNLIDGLLVDVYAYLLPELGHAAASSQFVRAADCAGRMRIAETYAECCEVEPADVAGACSWRGLAACWARNAVWLRSCFVSLSCVPKLPRSKLPRFPERRFHAPWLSQSRASAR